MPSSSRTALGRQLSCPTTGPTASSTRTGKCTISALVAPHAASPVHVAACAAQCSSHHARRAHTMRCVPRATRHPPTCPDSIEGHHGQQPPHLLASIGLAHETQHCRHGIERQGRRERTLTRPRRPSPRQDSHLPEHRNLHGAPGPVHQGLAGLPRHVSWQAKAFISLPVDVARDLDAVRDDELAPVDQRATDDQRDLGPGRESVQTQRHCHL